MTPKKALSNTHGATEVQLGPCAATVYGAPGGNVVFNAATICWADGLSEPPGYQRPHGYVPRNGPDARVQAITRNVLDRFVSSPGWAT